MERYKCAHTDRHITGNCTPPSIILASSEHTAMSEGAKKSLCTTVEKYETQFSSALCPSALPTRCLFISLHLFVSTLLSSHLFPTSHWLPPVNAVSQPFMNVMYMSITYLHQGVCLKNVKDLSFSPSNADQIPWDLVCG